MSDFNEIKGLAIKKMPRFWVWRGKHSVAQKIGNSSKPWHASGPFFSALLLFLFDFKKKRRRGRGCGEDSGCGGMTQYRGIFGQNCGGQF
ncbi:hypothetical protein [Pandoraea pnomenusa]|uniref:hypothetical protein n=1 Tax=Pandoraea pnomenusa TaxID=93220 RepID=UPI0024303EEC|nr:hypothetical protein [Pandoraea pnomenusa]